MKILILSDTHGNLRYAKEAILKSINDKQIDGVIHCGDHIKDAKILESEFPNLQFFYVPGNCDPLSFEEREKILVLENQKILITHGDKHGISHRDYEDFLEYLYKKKINIAVCGHTHIAHIENRKDENTIIINPGSISSPRDSSYPSYALLYIGLSGVEKAEILRIKG